MNVMTGSSLLLNSAGYQISRSVRLRSSASAYFNRTLTTPTDAKKWTWSGWVKRGILGASPNLFWAWSGSGNEDQLMFSTDTLRFYVNGGVTGNIITNAVFRDPSAWYHIIAVYDSANATSNDRMILYVNGVRQTLSTNTQPTLNYSNQFNTAVSHSLGRNVPAATYFDGYLTEINFIDGQALDPSYFGETNTITGVWQPKKYTGTYGTNGFYLNFSDNSAATAAAIGKDYSGNGNNWTPNNISVTAGVTYDSMLDVPTQWADGGNGRGNYAVLNPLATRLASGSFAVSNGNLNVLDNATSYGYIPATIAVSSSKWYWEVFVTSQSNSTAEIGIKNNTASDLNDNNGVAGTATSYSYVSSGNKRNNTTLSSYGASWTTNDVIGVALDMDTGTLTFYKNNSSQGTAFSGLVGEFFPAFGDYANAQSFNYAINFGQRPFSYTPPSGFKALNTLNLPTPTILKGNQYFNAVLYSGNSGSQSITGVGFQPDLVWGKSRNIAENNGLFDAVRGVNKILYSNLTNAEATDPGVSAFNADGFSLGGATINATGYTYVAWNWKAGGTPAVTNTAGSITSTVSVGATQGFSVVTFTTPGGSNPQTIGHGLGVAPRMIIMKSRNNVSGWNTYHASVGNTGSLNLQATTATSTSIDWWQNTSPTSSVWSIGANLNISTWTWVAYCFSEVAGFSKFGSYTGNGSADGPFVFLGFRPRWILTKAASGATGSWWLYDTARSTYNEMTDLLRPDLNNADTTQGFCDATANGFKIRNSGNNTNGATYIFAAFAENPFKYALAR